MSAESPAAIPVAERYLKLSKAYVKLANRYASLDVEHGKLRRILIKLLLSYRDLKKELAEAHEKIQSMEEQNQELQQFQALLGNEFLLALEEAEQAETNCEKLLSAEDEGLNHLALEVDEAVKQLEANLPIDVIGTEQPILEEGTASPASSLEASNPVEPVATEVTSEAALTEAPEVEAVETEEEPMYEVAQAAAPEPISVDDPAPIAAESEEPVYEVVQETEATSVSLVAEVAAEAEAELIYEVAQETTATEAPAVVSSVETVEEAKSEESTPSATQASASPSDDWDLAMGVFDVA